MSGESVFSFPKKTKPSLMEERLGLESDRRLFGCMASGSVLGTVLVTYVLTIRIVNPLMAMTHCPIDPGRPAPLFQGIPPPDIHAKLHPPKPKITKFHPNSVARHAPKPTSEHPAKVAGTLAVKLISSISNRSDFSAYDLIGKTLKNLDQDKLEHAAVLTRTGETRLSGRPGMQRQNGPEGYDPGGTGGVEGIEMPGFTGTSLPPRARPDQEIAAIVSIDMRASETIRSSASILAVIRSHAPGLRHLYNTYLRTQPGMRGKVTLRFAIAPSGQVVDVGLESSTTDAPGFDKLVAEKVMAWRFEPVKGIGNDMVTVPFNFSE